MLTLGSPILLTAQRAAILMGDPVSRSPAMSKDELSAIMDIGDAVLLPCSRGKPDISVVAIQVPEDTPKAEVAWSWRLPSGRMAPSMRPAANAVTFKKI